MARLFDWSDHSFRLRLGQAAKTKLCPPHRPQDLLRAGEHSCEVTALSRS